MSEKLRTVLQDPRGEEVCLMDVVDAYVRAAEKFKNLEYKNSAHALREAKKSWREANKVRLQFHERIYGEVTEEIMIAKSKVDKRVDLKDPETKKFFGK